MNYISRHMQSVGVMSNVLPSFPGCMVPFSMRLVYADLPRLTGHSQETLDRLCSILVTVRKVCDVYQPPHTHSHTYV